MGEHTEITEVAPDHKLLIWQTNSGNVILELESFDTEIVLTSSSVKNAKKISIYSRISGQDKFGR
jgi:hypothetical protein